MTENEIRSWAKTMAEGHLEDFDFMGVYEVLEFEGVDVSDEDAAKIHELITHAKVSL